MKAIFIFPVIILFSCSKSLISGEIVKDTRKVGSFSSISLSVSANVYLSQGSQQNIEIEGDKESLTKIETIVEGNMLKIKTKEIYNACTGKINIYIVVPVIERLIVTGSGNVISQNPLKINELTMNVSGSGSIKIQQLTVNQVDVEISGSGNIELTSGKAENALDIIVTGSGNYAGEGFQANKVKVNITGSGSARVWAVSDLETYITGSGNVYYKGNPLINANAVGSGRTRAMEK
jgi:hypothetical protein